MKSLPVNRPTLDDPIYSQKNPYQTFLVALSIIASVPLLQGRTSSAVLEAQLGDRVVIMWGLSLLLGSVVVLVSELWRGHTWTALAIERSGLMLVGTGAGIYSTVVWTTAGEMDPLRSGIVLTTTLAAALLWRRTRRTLLVATLERYGLLAGACGVALLAGAEWATLGDVSPVRFVAAITFAYSASCFWRCAQITRRLAWIRALVREVNARHEP